MQQILLLEINPHSPLKYAMFTKLLLKKYRKYHKNQHQYEFLINNKHKILDIFL